MIAHYTTLFYSIILLFLLNGCALVYKDPNLNTYKEKHKSIAIMPFGVSYEKAKLPKGMSLEQRKQLELEEGKLLQGQLYNYIEEHNRKKKKKIATIFQSFTLTDSLMKAAGITQTNIHEYSYQQVAKILGVDAIINVNLRMTYFMSDFAAVAIMALTPFTAATKEIDVVASLTDGSSGKVVWSYQQPLRGGAFTDDLDMILLVEHKILKQFPYKTK